MPHIMSHVIRSRVDNRQVGGLPEGAGAAAGTAATFMIADGGSGADCEGISLSHFHF